MEDNMIIGLYLKRVENAIKETELKYGKYCKTIANNIVCNINDAEECVNDTYLKTWNSIPPTIPQRFKAYIGRITRNIAINRYKEKNRIKRGSGEIELAIEELEECLPSQKSVEVEMESSRVMEIVNCFLDTLSEDNRNIFVKRYWYTKSISEIANEYSMSESNVKVVLFRIRKKLKEHLIKEDVYI